MPIKSSYHCGKRFAVDELRAVFAPAKEHCFITFTPRECLLWRAAGTKRSVLKTIEIDLHTDSARGGQSAPRFGRIRAGQRQALLKQIAEESRVRFPGQRPLVAGSGVLGDEYCRSIGSGEMIRIAATDRAGAMKETLQKAAAVLEDDEIAAKAHQQAAFEEQLAIGAPLLFGDEIEAAATYGNLKKVFSDGSKECPVVNEVVPVLDLTAYGGLVGVPFFFDAVLAQPVNEAVALNPNAAEYHPRADVADYL